MPMFAVYGSVVGTKYLGQIEAATREEAIEKLGNDAGVQLCHHCSSECEDPEIHEFVAEEIP